MQTVITEGLPSDGKGVHKRPTLNAVSYMLSTMRKLFTTDGVEDKSRFRLWRDVCEDRLVPMAQMRLDDGPFDALIESADIGSVGFTKFSLRNLRAATTPQTIRHENNKTDQLFISMVISGSVSAIQNDRSSVTVAGDISIRDTNTPWTIEHAGYSEVIAVAVPRQKLESILGSARNFVGLTIDGHHPVTMIARSFISSLLQVGNQLELRAAERMASAGVDLIAASVAERMAMETPKALRSTLIVQRAIAHIRSNISDPELSPAHVAAGVGVSLRNLQILFRQDGRNIAAWIWQQRLEQAARRLSDPAYLHLPLGELARSCGFSDQAHFSRRFRNCFGLSPRDYRHEKLDR